MNDEGHAEPHDDSEQHAKNGPSPNNDPSTTNTQPPKPDKIEKLEKRIEMDQWIMIALTAAIALAGFLQWRAIGGQLEEMRKGSGDTHDLAVAAGKQADAAKVQSGQAKAQTDKMQESLAKTQSLIDATNRLATESKRSADTAHDSVVVAKKSLEIQERPWIGITGLSLKDNIEVGKTLSGNISIENSGNTPALHVRQIFVIRPICGEFPKRPPYGAGQSQAASERIILPHSTEESGDSIASGPLKEEGMKLYKAAGCHLYAYAKVTYSDIFGHTHWRHMCGFWDETTAKTFDVCPTYNDGDEDYKGGQEP